MPYYIRDIGLGGAYTVNLPHISKKRDPTQLSRVWRTISVNRTHLSPSPLLTQSHLLRLLCTVQGDRGALDLRGLASQARSVGLRAVVFKDRTTPIANRSRVIVLYKYVIVLYGSLQIQVPS